MQRNIKVLIVEPDKLPYEKIIKNTLQEKQKIVGGYIEYTYMLNDNSIALICNEEGKLDNLPFNRDIGHDIIAGTFIIVGDNDTGEDRSLDDYKIDQYKKIFNKESIIKTKEKIETIKLKKSLDL